MKTFLELNFRLEALPGSNIAPRQVIDPRYGIAEIKKWDRRRENKHRERLAARFGLTTNYYTIKFPPNLPRLAEVTASLQKDLASGLSRVASANLNEIPVVDEQTGWFELRPHRFFSAPDEMLPGVHVSTCHRGAIVSNRFREVVIASGLTGIEFLWAGDKGRFIAPQWYHAMAKAPIGRGIDHPWFDPATARGGFWNQWTEPEFRAGVRSFANDQLKTGAISDAAITNFVAMVSAGKMHFSSVPRFLKECLPTSDFAYTWNSNFHRSLCCNRKARDVFDSEGLLKDAHFAPFDTIDQLPPGCALLDGIAPPPPTAFSSEEAEQMRRAEAVYLQAASLHPKPPRSDDIDRAIQVLTDWAKEKGIEPVHDRRSIDRVDRRLPHRLPESWKRVLEIASGIGIHRDVQVVGIERLRKWNLETGSWNADSPDLAGTNILQVACVGNGDWFGLVIGAGVTADCPVIKFDHETNLIDRLWSSVAAFLEEVFIATRI